jgi:restriction system protein
VTGDELVDWIGRLSMRAVAILAAGLVLLGFVVPFVVPDGQGWISVLRQTAPLFWGLALFVVAVVVFGRIRAWGDREVFESGATLEQLTWQQFESFLAEYFRRRGAKTTYRGGGTADGGVDLVIEDALGRRLVQAKHWKRRSVGVDTVRALWGVVQHERADGAVMVTSGNYTREALRFADGKRYELIDGDRLGRLIREVKAAQAKPKTAPGEGDS